MGAMRKRIGAVLACIAAVGASAIAAAPATASVEQDCGVFVDTGETICVPRGEDLHAAVLEQTGQVIVDAAAPSARSSSADGIEAGVAATYLLARLYDGTSYSGSYWDLYGSSSCVSGQWMGNANISFQDRASSMRGYSNCKVKVYEHTNYGGASYGYYSYSSSISSTMNNKASSVRVSG